MRKPLPYAIALVLATASVHAQPARTDRSGYTGIIPKDWTMVAPRRGLTERRFESPRGNAWLLLYAEPAREPVPTHLDRLRSVKGGDITYEREGRTWIVVSGYKGNRIFYRKAMLACGGRAWHYLEFEYPAWQKRAFDQFVTLASAALGTYAQSGCRA